MTNWSRNPRRPDRRHIAASVVFHVLVLAVGWWAHRAAHNPIEYITYQMQMVSVADLEDLVEAALPEPDDLVVESPEDPVLPQPEPEPPPPPEPDPVPPEPDPPVQEPPPDPPVQEPPPDPPVQQQQQAEPPPTQAERVEEASTADIMTRMEGLQRDFPAYYRTIVAEIQRCHRPPAGVDRGTTVLRFVIVRDGTVPPASIRIHERSGNTRLDIAAVGAVECAGGGRFGPLPDDLPFDELPVQFAFGARG